MITTINLIKPSVIVRYYRLHSLCCTWHPCHSFYYWKIVPSPFLPILPLPFLLAAISLFSVSTNLCLFSAIFFIGDFVYLFLESREGRKKKRERNISVQDKLIGCLSHAPNRGPGLQPRHVPWLGIKLATFWLAGWHSVHWATPAGVDPQSLFSLV